MKNTHFILDMHETSQEVKVAVREAIATADASFDLCPLYADRQLAFRSNLMDAVDKASMAVAIEGVAIKAIQAFCTWSDGERLPSTHQFMVDWLGDQPLIGPDILSTPDDPVDTPISHADRAVRAWYWNFLSCLSGVMQLDDTVASAMGPGSTFGQLIYDVKEAVDASPLTRRLDWVVLRGPRRLMVESGSLVVNREYLKEVLESSSGLYAHFNIDDAIKFPTTHPLPDEHEVGHLSSDYDEANAAILREVTAASPRYATQVYTSSSQTDTARYVQRLMQRRAREVYHKASGPSVPGSAVPNPATEALLRRWRSDESAMYSPVETRQGDVSWVALMAEMEAATKAADWPTVQRIINYLASEDSLY